MNRLSGCAILVFIYLSTPLYAQPQPYPGWPFKAIPYPSITTVPNWCPELANLDAMPDLEILAGFGYDSLYAWKTDATNLSPWPKAPEPGFVHWGNIPTVGDVDGDRKLEILVSSTPPRYIEPCKLHIFKNNGQELEGWPLVLPTWRHIKPVLADLNKDGKLEIIFNILVDDTLVYVYDYTGKPYPGWPQKVIYEPVWGNIGSFTPAVGDLDRDGNLEIVAFAWDNLYAWHSDGTLLPGFPVPPPTGYVYFINPVLADMEGDGTLEIVAQGYAPASGPDFTSFLTVLDHQGQAQSGFPRIFYDGFLYSAPCVGDIDKDGLKEIVVEQQGFPDWPEFKNLYLVRKDGTDYPGWPIWVPAASWYQIALADVDGDGFAEIITLDNLPVSGYASIYANRLDGSSPEGFPIRVIGSTAFHTPAFADVDRDGTLDMAVISDHGVTVSRVDYYTYLFKLSGVPYDPSTLLWPQYGHDDYNTNNADFKISYKIGDPNADGKINIVDIVFMVNYVFRRRLMPNPFWNCDVNCDTNVNLGDIIYLGNSVFKDGSPPCQ